MEKALSLLKTGEYSVTEACAGVGCPDIYYFNKLFNKAYGKNPSEFIPR
jgi:two-component system response regulator YesN